MTVRGFFRQDDRDAEAAVLDGITLQGIVGFGRERRVQAVLQGLFGPGIRPERGPQHAAILLVDEPVEFFRFPDVIFRLFVHRPAERADDLTYLLFRGHAREQVCGPIFGTAGRVLIDVRAVSARNNQHQDSCKGHQEGGNGRKGRMEGGVLGKWF